MITWTTSPLPALLHGDVVQIHHLQHKTNCNTGTNNITPTHPDPTDVSLAIRRDTQGCCKLGCNDALGQGIANRTRHVGLLLLRRTDAMMGCHRRYVSVLKQCSRRMQKILPAVRRDTQEIQARFNYLNGCNELMQQVGLKRRVTEFPSVVDNAWR